MVLASGTASPSPPHVAISVSDGFRVPTVAELTGTMQCAGTFRLARTRARRRGKSMDGQRRFQRYVPVFAVINVSLTPTNASLIQTAQLAKTMDSFILTPLPFSPLK